jgi:hypothetical protein
MATTVVALFDRREDAGTAVQALLAAKFTTTDIDAIVEVDPNVRGELAEAVRKGAVVVAVRALGESGRRARAILQEAGAVQVGEYPFSWQHQGWEGFELAASDVEVASTAVTRDLYRDGGEGSDTTAGPEDGDEPPRE